LDSGTHLQVIDIPDLGVDGTPSNLAAVRAVLRAVELACFGLE
jgi:hypothetical protein